MKHFSKQMFSFAVAALFTTALLSSCSKTDKMAEQIKDSVNAHSNGANGNAAKPADAPNAGAAAANGQAGGVAVKSTILAAFLPTLSGFDAKEPENMDMNMQGMSYASATRKYTSGDKTVTLSIFDYNHMAAMTSMYSMYLGGMSVETGEESMHSTKISGNPGWIDWKKKENSGTIGVVVADRFFVIAEGHGGISQDELQSMAEKIDYSGLSKAH
ncbi:MAG: hypothetical protein ABI444_11295 [Candidatus Kapaibacterium sp.]|jgi:hypothetical protein